MNLNKLIPFGIGIASTTAFLKLSGINIDPTPLTLCCYPIGAGFLTLAGRVLTKADFAPDKNDPPLKGFLKAEADRTTGPSNLPYLLYFLSGVGITAGLASVYQAVTPYLTQ